MSRGELARLALAMISISEIDLLVLDESTNNLDLETVSQIVEALEEYRGAICVISHDLDFLANIIRILTPSLLIVLALRDRIQAYISFTIWWFIDRLFVFRLFFIFL